MTLTVRQIALLLALISREVKSFPNDTEHLKRLREIKVKLLLEETDMLNEEKLY